MPSLQRLLQRLFLLRCIEPFLAPSVRLHLLTAMSAFGELRQFKGPTERNSGDFTIYQALASLRGRSFQGWDSSKRSCDGAIGIAVKR